MAGARGAARPPVGSSRVSFAGYAVAVLLLAVVACATLLAVSSWHPTPRDIVAAMVLAAGFALARRVAIEIDVRRDSVRITTTEAVLAAGLILAPGPIVLLSFTFVIFLVGLCRRDHWPKLVFNVANHAVLAAVSATIFELLSRETLTGGAIWLAALGGVGLGTGLSSLLNWLAFVLLSAARRASHCARLTVQSFVVEMLSAVAGVAAVQIVWSVPWGWALAGLFLLVLIAMYRTYYALLREQRDLGLLNEVSMQVAGAGRDADRADLEPSAGEADDEVWRPALELVREQLNATRVVLHRRVDSDAPPRTVVTGTALPNGAPQNDLAAVTAADISERIDAGVHRLRLNDAGFGVGRALQRRGASEILLAPLRGAGELLGLIEVHDRQSALRGFSDGDVRLVETLASHLTTAMDNRRLLGRLRYDAYHDSLTGLRNRLGFREAAAEVLHRHEKCAIVVLDLDVLSSVNETLGHAWGDHIVLTAGRRLRDALPSTVLTARLEGDTFAALLVDVETDEVLATAQRVRAVLSEAYPVDKLAVECNAVVGIAETAVEPTFDVDSLLQRGDVAVQAARSGDVAVRRYVPSMGQVFLRRFQLVTQFRQALDEGHVDVHFQPKMALPGREVIGVEALVRWQHPDFGTLDPEEFVVIVEATGLIDALTDFVLEEALRQCRAWLDRGLRLSVAVNLSVRNLADPEFPDRVIEALRRHDVPAALLAFELTESAVMSDPKRALPVLRRLHALGVHLAVDDFGTGYSSLAYLRRLPVDEVKIDKSFVLGMGTDLGDLAVVRAIVDLGHSLDLTVVAEGVEEDAARDQLIEMGCDVVQGYLISRPMGPERFDAWLRARTVRVRGRRDETVLTLVH